MQRKILLIDDDTLVLRSFENLLCMEGYHVFAVTSYDSAISVIEDEPIDLVVSDIRMPGKNGVETVEEIQLRLKNAKKPDLPIIFITGFAKMGSELNANFHGEVLYKPVDSDLLLATIREYL